MIDRSKLKNSFEFVVVSGARQLLKGAQPRVEASAKVVRTAEREVQAGAVQKIEETDEAGS